MLRRSHHRHSTLLRRVSQVLLGGLCLLLIVSLQRVPATAQSGIRSAIIAEIIDGSQVYIQNQQARVNDTASQGQRVRTGQSRTQLLFNTGAVGRLGPNSTLTVGQKCARLQRGILLVNGVANGCTSSVTTGVRGTTYVIEVDENDQSQVKVLEGEVTIAPPDSGTEPEAPLIPTAPATPKQLATPRPKPTPAQPALPTPSPTPTVVPTPTPDTPGNSNQGEQRSLEQPIVLTSGQKATVQPGADPIVGQMSQEEFESLLKGALFNGYSVQIPGISKVQSAFSELFPGVPFPIDIPGLSIPGLPIPSIPGLPF